LEQLLDMDLLSLDSPDKAWPRLFINHIAEATKQQHQQQEQRAAATAEVPC